jgi:hypothetical protein
MDLDERWASVEIMRPASTCSFEGAELPHSCSYNILDATHYCFDEVCAAN